MNKIKIQNVCKNFSTENGKRQVLKNVSFEIPENSCTVIGGENGSGKSLLMSIIAGLEKPSSGNVSVQGKVGLVFQEAETQILGETPREDISIGPKNLGWTKESVKKKIARPGEMQSVELTPEQLAQVSDNITVAIELPEEDVE